MHAAIKRDPVASPEDVLAVVEAAYALDRPYALWARGILESVEDVVRGDVGGFACPYRIVAGSHFALDVDALVSIGVTRENLDVVTRGLQEAPPAWVSRLAAEVRGPTCVLTSEADPRHELAYRAQRVLEGLDGVNLIALDVD